METNPVQNTQTKATRHYARVMAFAVVAILLIAGGFLLLQNGDPVEVLNPQVEEVATSTDSAYGRSAPTHLNIPAVGIQADFEEPLGLNEDQTIEVPDTYTEVGWYKHGPTPGEQGPAVVLGHVDSFEGPAVFWPLKELEEGDEVHIEREDGTIATFIVTSKATYDQNEFPTEEVYGPTEFPELRLVTCSGTYDKGIQRYSHNLVVYAILKE